MERYFIVIHRPLARTTEVRQFAHAPEALAELALCEGNLEDDSTHVVLFTSESLETLRRTHGSYFDGSDVQVRAA